MDAHLAKIQSQLQAQVQEGKTVGEERAEAKRQKRVENRKEVVDATKEQDKTKLLLGPRAVLEEQLKRHLEEKESNEETEISETTE